MTAIKSERPAATRLGANGGSDAASASDPGSFEGEIREFIRRDVAVVRRAQQQAEPTEPAQDAAAEHVNTLVRRVTGGSMEEIDRVILELQAIRDMLRNEGDRVTREVSGFASLNHAAITSMRVIADSLAQWKNGAVVRPQKN
jgi:hypothetical protein